jgi:hypothetical protein
MTTGRINQVSIVPRPSARAPSAPVYKHICINTRQLPYEYTILQLVSPLLSQLTTTMYKLQRKRVPYTHFAALSEKES